MTWTKIKMAVVIGAGVMVAGGTGMIARAMLSDTNNFEAEGYLFYGASVRTLPFKVIVSGDKWLIRTTYNTNGILYTEEAFDGKYNYVYTQLAGRSKNSANSSIGEVEQDDIPSIHSDVVPVWLAYGASRFFDGVTGKKVKPFLIASGLRPDRDHLLDVEWQRSKQAPFVATYIYCQEINYQYRVTQFTNFSGLSVPSEFAFETFPIGASLTNAPNYFVHGFLTKISKPATIKEFRPVMDGHTYMTDRRFPNIDPMTYQAGNYVHTSNEWFSTNSPQWQALLKMWDSKSGNLVWPRKGVSIPGVEH